MGYTTKYGNYVKFLRGTPSGWESLTVKDSDTLYFIAETGADHGELYLGNKLIAKGDSATHIRDLEGVLLNEGIPTNSLLVYDAASDAWKNMPLQQVMSYAVGIMKGATEDSNGVAGMVPMPAAGQQDLYLKGDATWGNPVEQVEQDLAELTDTVAENALAWKSEMMALRGGKTGTITDITNDLVDAAVAKLVAEAPEDFDTLKEIADWITQHDGVINIADIVVKVDKHENALFDTDSSVGLVTKVGSLDKIINDPNSGLSVKLTTVTGNLNKALADIMALDRGLDSLGADLEAFKEYLKWQLLVEETDV